MKSIILSLLFAISASAQTNTIISEQPEQFNGGHVTNSCNGTEYRTLWIFTNNENSINFNATTTNSHLALICNTTDSVTCVAFCFETVKTRCAMGRLDFTNDANEHTFILECTTPFHVRNFPLPVGTNIGFQP